MFNLVLAHNDLPLRLHSDLCLSLHSDLSVRLDSKLILRLHGDLFMRLQSDLSVRLHGPTATVSTDLAWFSDQRETSCTYEIRSTPLPATNKIKCHSMLLQTSVCIHSTNISARVNLHWV